jgi:hypothetical protein
MYITLFDEQEVDVVPWNFYMVFCASSILHFDGCLFLGFLEVLPRWLCADGSCWIWKFYQASNLKATIVARCTVGTETYFSKFHEGL